MCEPSYYTTLFHHSMFLFQPSQLTKGKACQAQCLSCSVWGSWKWNYSKIYSVPLTDINQKPGIQKTRLLIIFVNTIHKLKV